MAVLTEEVLDINRDLEEGINDFNVEEELPLFFLSLLDKTDYLIHNDSRNVSGIRTLLVVLDQTISLLRLILEEANEDDQQQWELLAGCFETISQNLQRHTLELSLRPTNVTSLRCNISQTGRPGRPSFLIQPEMLEDLLELGFSKQRIGRLLGVSRWTIYRRVQEYGLYHVSAFSDLSDAEIDEKIRGYINRHGRTTGEVFLMGYLRSLGIHVPRRRLRASITRIDPANVALRWGAAVYRRCYQVPWANSLWHLDGHHSLIRWSLVIHGCIDGFSRRIIFLHCSANNLATTVLNLFHSAVERDGGIWPSRIRVDYGVENVLVCEAMVENRGADRGSFIAGPSTHNQRIERLWRDVFRCVCHYYYYVFYGMEDSEILDTSNSLHMFALHFVFLPRINQALQEYLEAFNHHKMRTARNWSPYQMWVNNMMNPDNPLSSGGPDNVPENVEFYGYDPHGPPPFEDSNNNIVVEPLSIANANEIEAELLQVIDPLMPSVQMGIDIYEEVLDLLGNYAPTEQ